MKKLLTCAVAVLALLAVQHPASAGTSSKLRPINEAGDTQPCATYSETLAVFVGMPRHRVQRVLDTPGHRGGRKILGDAAEVFGDHVSGRRAVTFVLYPLCPDAGGDGEVMVVSYDGRPRERAVAIFYGPRSL